MNSSKKLLFYLCLSLSFALASGNRAPHFYPDDPIREDPDQLSIPKPAERELSEIADLLYATYQWTPEGPIGPALNVNTLGEVPDSSWFQNRIGQREMSPEELARGPNSLEGPDLSAPWTITSAKFEGITPGFFVQDARGDQFLIKFDPKHYPQMATSAEVIVTKFFHAFGYHVPENYLARVPLDQFRIGTGAEVEEKGGRERQMTREDLEEMFEQVPIAEDGTVQVVASRLLPGQPLGPFKYFGVREDDPNDIFPHQDRRELRGLMVFASWLNHDDSRSINSLDTYVGNTPDGYVKHHLIDFGSTLGSGSVQPQKKRAGNEYMLEWGPILRAAFTLGIWDRAWRYVDYPDYPSIGRFEGDFFEPQKWKPEYPNPAFQRMLADDGLWAARIVYRLDEQAIRTLVATGEYEDKEAEEYLIDTLIKRRRKILDYYLAQIAPLTDFLVQPSEADDGDQKSGTLSFQNLGEKWAALGQTTSYEYRWFTFDNSSGSTAQISEDTLAGNSPDSQLAIPSAQHDFLMVEIVTIDEARPNWNLPVRVYLRMKTGPEVVGIEREVPQPEI